MNNEIYKLPRLFVTTPLRKNDVITLTENQAHYLNTVLRRKNEDQIRVFNGQDGEWIGTLYRSHKKKAELIVQRQHLAQPPSTYNRTLYFAPIKKTNLEWMIEKAVELGVTNLQPIITQYVQHRNLNTKRMNSQIIEASEQCERLTIPKLHETINISQINNKKSILLACIERKYGKNIQEINKNQDLSIIIGPEGGFSNQETQFLIEKCENISLGTQILRAETAAIKALSILSA